MSGDNRPEPIDEQLELERLTREADAARTAGVYDHAEPEKEGQ